MTHEDAKKLGATHYGGINKIGYFKRSEFKWYLLCGDVEWVLYSGDMKVCHDIYWFFGWHYRHRFENPELSHRRKPL